jgi:hypothetical protein
MQDLRMFLAGYAAAMGAAGLTLDKDEQDEYALMLKQSK